MLKLDKIRNLLGKASLYSELFADQRFQIWKREVVDKRLEAYKEAALNTEPGTKEHDRAMIRYQELSYLVDGVFKVWKNIEDEQRKKLEEAK
jgi:hypothetical protein